MTKVAAYKHYGLDVHELDANHTYAVGTDEQADAAAREYVRDSLWAFKPEFLARYMPDGIDAEIITIIVEKKYEDATELFARLIGDKLGELIDDAIASDGRGHFLASYDSEERDCKDVEGLEDLAGKVCFRI